MCRGQQTWAVGQRGGQGQFGFGDHMESRGIWEASAMRKPGLGSPRKGPQDGQGGLMGGQLWRAGRPTGGRGQAPARRARPDVLDACLPTGSWNILAGGRGIEARGRRPRWEPGKEPGGLYGRGQSTLSHLRGMAPPPAPRSSPQQPGRDQQTARSRTAPEPGALGGGSLFGEAAHLWPGSSPAPQEGMCVG